MTNDMMDKKRPHQILRLVGENQETNGYQMSMLTLKVNVAWSFRKGHFSILKSRGFINYVF